VVRICKQEVVGSIPTNSTFGLPTNTGFLTSARRIVCAIPLPMEALWKPLLSRCPSAGVALPSSIGVICASDCLIRGLTTSGLEMAWMAGFKSEVPRRGLSAHDGGRRVRRALKEPPLPAGRDLPQRPRRMTGLSVATACASSGS
jgi:hypothetical protein